MMIFVNVIQMIQVYIANNVYHEENNIKNILIKILIIKNLINYDIKISKMV